MLKALDCSIILCLYYDPGTHLTRAILIPAPVILNVAKKQFTLSIYQCMRFK